MSNPPTRPLPGPRTKRPPGASASSSDHLSNQSQATSRPQATARPTGPKAKGPHPWMTMVHPGPWTQLPPAASPLSPPGTSCPRRGWYKARVAPPNPFEESNKDANRLARRRASERPAGPAKGPETTSQPRKNVDVCGPTCSTEPSKAVTVSCDNSEPAPLDDPGPSETLPLEALPPTTAHLDASAAVSPGLSETHRVSQCVPPAAPQHPEGLGDAPRLAPLIGLGGGLELVAMPPTSTDFPNVTSLDSLLKGGPLSGLAEGANPLHLLCNVLGGLAIDVEEDRTGGRGVQTGVAGLASGLGVPDSAGNAALMEGSKTPGLGSSHRYDLSGGLAASGDRPGSLEVIGVPDLVDSGSCMPDIGSSPGVPGVPDMGDGCSAMGSLMESARPRASAPDPGPFSLPKCLSMPAIFSAVKKYKGLRDLESLASSSRRSQAPGHGFPPIKRTIQTDSCVPTDGLQGKLEEVTKQMQKLELCRARLESNLRDGKNKKQEEEEAMLNQWMALIQEKQTLMSTEALIAHLMKQEALEQRQADLEYELRCLLSKPETHRSSEDGAQEQRMLVDLLGIIDRRNQIISSLDEDRQREKEEDSMLELMQKREFQKEILRELKNSRGNFNPLKVLRKLSTQAV